MTPSRCSAYRREKWKDNARTQPSKEAPSGSRWPLPYCLCGVSHSHEAWAIASRGSELVPGSYEAEEQNVSFVASHVA